MFIGFYETVLKQVLGGHKDQSYQKKNIVLKKSFEAFWDFHIIEKSWIQTNQNAPSECTSTNCGYDFF